MKHNRELPRGLVSSVALTVGSLLLASVLPSAFPPEATATRRPDVVVIVLDDATSEMLGSMPNVQSTIVAHGVSFPDAMVPTSLCCPSRASLLTGNYAHTTGVYHNKPPDGGFRGFDDSSTLATWLDAGYRTGLFGKYLNGYRQGYVPPGWDQWFGAGHGYVKVPYTTKDGSQLRTQSDVYAPYFFGDKVSAFIRNTNPAEPLFAYYAPYNPHKPALPAPEDVGTSAGIDPWRPPNFNEADQSDKPSYVRGRSVDPASVDPLHERRYESLLSADHAIGRIMAALEDSGRLANTLVIVLSDNGFMLGEHGLFSKSVPYDASTRVFLAMRYDQLPWAGSPSGIVANIDVAPTIQDVTGVVFPPMDGRSLSRMAVSGTPIRSFLTLEAIAGVQGRPAYCGVRSLQWLYVRYGDGFEELYNYDDDPYELSNVASDPAMGALLKDLRRRTKARCDPVPPGFIW